MTKCIIFFIIHLLLISYTPHGGHKCTNAADYAKIINANTGMVLTQDTLTTNYRKVIQNMQQYFVSIQSYTKKCNCHRAYELAKDGQRYCDNISNIKKIETLHDYMEHIQLISEGIITYCEICDN